MWTISLAAHLGELLCGGHLENPPHNSTAGTRAAVLPFTVTSANMPDKLLICLLKITHTQPNRCVVKIILLGMTYPCTCYLWI